MGPKKQASTGTEQPERRGTRVRKPPARYSQTRYDSQAAEAKASKRKRQQDQGEEVQEDAPPPPKAVRSTKKTATSSKNPTIIKVRVSKNPSSKPKKQQPTTKRAAKRGAASPTLQVEASPVPSSSLEPFPRYPGSQTPNQSQVRVSNTPSPSAPTGSQSHTVNRQHQSAQQQARRGFRSIELGNRLERVPNTSGVHLPDYEDVAAPDEEEDIRHEREVQSYRECLKCVSIGMLAAANLEAVEMVVNLLFHHTGS